MVWTRSYHKTSVQGAEYNGGLECTQAGAESVLGGPGWAPGCGKWSIHHPLGKATLKKWFQAADCRMENSLEPDGDF